jgi:hypothetical protein
MEERVVRSVLLSEREEQQIRFFVKNKGVSTWLLGLLRRDASEPGPWLGTPVELSSAWTKKQSLSIPAELDAAVTRRCAEVGFSAYMRGLLMSEPLAPQRARVAPLVHSPPLRPARKMTLFEQLMVERTAQEGPVPLAPHLHAFLWPAAEAQEARHVMGQVERDEITGVISPSGALLAPPPFPPYFVRVVLGVERGSRKAELRWLAEGVPVALRPLFDQMLHQIAANARMRNQRWEVHLRRVSDGWRTAIDCWILRSEKG